MVLKNKFLLALATTITMISSIGIVSYANQADSVPPLSNYNRIFLLDKKIDETLSIADRYKYIRDNFIIKDYYKTYENIINWENTNINSLYHMRGMESSHNPYGEDNILRYMGIADNEENYRLITKPLSMGVSVYSMINDNDSNHGIKYETSFKDGSHHQNFIMIYVPRTLRDLLVSENKKIDLMSNEILDNVVVPGVETNKITKSISNIEYLGDGSYKVTVSVVSDSGSKVNVEVDVKVTDNEAPKVGDIKKETVLVGDNFIFVMPNAVDNIDEDVEIKVKNVLPDGVIFDEATKIIQGRISSEGSYDIELEYIDDYGNKTVKVFTIIATTNDNVNKNIENDICDIHKKVICVHNINNNEIYISTSSNAYVDLINEFKNHLKDIEKDLIKCSQSGSSNELQSIKDEYEKLKNALSNVDRNSDINDINKQLGRLTERINDFREERNNNIIYSNRSIKIYQWFPEAIIKKPAKIKYKDNEIVELEGLVVRFSRYKRSNGVLTKENKDVSYNELKNRYKGWEMVLKTETINKSNSINGKANVDISFILKDVSASNK